MVQCRAMPTIHVLEFMSTFQIILLIIAAFTACAVLLTLWFDSCIPELLAFFGTYLMCGRDKQTR